MTAITRALEAKRARLNEDEKGFTLIELLVVVLIIGILTAIAVPVFLGQQDSARDAAVKSDLANAKVAVIAYAAANDGTYTLDKADLADFGFVESTDSDGTLTVKSASSAGICIDATSTTTNAFHITATTGAETGLCP